MGLTRSANLNSRQGSGLGINAPVIDVQMERSSPVRRDGYPIFASSSATFPADSNTFRRMVAIR
jgi:hypothetical protein